MFNFISSIFLFFIKNKTQQNNTVNKNKYIFTFKELEFYHNFINLTNLIIKQYNYNNELIHTYKFISIINIAIHLDIHPISIVKCINNDLDCDEKYFKWTANIDL